MEQDKALGLMTFNEMFTGPQEGKKEQTIKKIKQLKSAKENSGKNELLSVLRNQRVHIDQNAIHFVASPRAGPRADARNSVFKLSQRYQQLPDRENVSRIRQMFQKVKEEEDSGDDEWAPKYGKVPDVLKGRDAAKMLDEPSPEHLIDEVQNIGDEAQKAPEGVLTQKEIDDEQVVENFVDRANARSSAGMTEKQAIEPAPAEGDNDSDDEDDDTAVHFDEADLNVLNSMQREFISMNLFAWFTDVRKAYETGVKLVKVNALGYKFIRIVEVKNFILTIKQPHTLSKVKIDRQVAVTSIEGVHLGKESRQFKAMADLIKETRLPPEEDPPATQCAVVHLPDNRTLSLIFLDEDNRNGFAFFLRVMIKKALAATKQLVSK